VIFINKNAGFWLAVVAPSNSKKPAEDAGFVIALPGLESEL
jgi:hypothetical protein